MKTWVYPGLLALSCLVGCVKETAKPCSVIILSMFPVKLEAPA